MFSISMHCYGFCVYLHGIHFLVYSGLNQNLYFTAETAGSSESGGSKVQCWQQPCPY